MAQTETEVVQRELRIEARPETVFAFLTDLAKMLRWKGLAATLDPRPGGIYRVEMSKHVVRGEYVEVDSPRRVVFTWGWEDGGSLPAGSSTVEVTLTPDGDATILRLVHRDLPAELRAPHTEGWQHYLSRLTTAAAGGDPGPDPWTMDQ